MSNKFIARDLLQFPPLHLKEILPKRFTLVFDDGEFETTRRRTVASSFFWDYHRHFTKMPMLMDHHLQLIYEKDHYNSDTHTVLCEKIEKDIYPLYEMEDDNLIAKLSKIAYDSSIQMTNELMPDLAPYVSPLDILDAIEIHRHNELWQAMEEASPDGRSVRKVYEVADRIIRHDPAFDHNGLALAYRRNTVKREQVLQTVSFRGVGTEPDGMLFKLSANTGYLAGFTKIFDFASDSRSAPKAQMSAEAPLQDSEYMARRLQFLASVVERIEGWDCGTTDLKDWLIDAEKCDEDGVIITKGGVSTMVGKFIEDPDTGKLIALTGKEKHLNGRYVRMRSVLGCKNPNPHTVCKTCFGLLHRNYYPHQNLGHVCTVTFTEKVTQNTLSTKHLVSTGEGARIQLNPISSRYFKVGKNKCDYLIQNYLKKLQARISVSHEEAVNLVDVMKMPDISDLKVSMVSKLTDVKLTYREKGSDHTDIVPLNQNNRKAFISLPFMKYIKEHGYRVDEENNFEVDLKDWAFDEPIFSVPQMEVSYSEHGQEVGRLIESNMSQIDERQKPESPMNTLQELSTLVSSKLDVPLACLEVIVYASMVPSRNNAALARGWESPVLGVARQIIYSRSLSCAYAFQGHADFMFNAKSFFPHFRPDNKMDVFFAPSAAVADEKYRRAHGLE